MNKQSFVYECCVCGTAVLFNGIFQRKEDIRRCHDENVVHIFTTDVFKRVDFIFVPRFQHPFHVFVCAYTLRIQIQIYALYNRVANISEVSTSP